MFAVQLIGYYDNPCVNSYYQVLGYLKRDGYSLNEFPLSDMPYDRRIIHIKNLFKLTTISNEHQ